MLHVRDAVFLSTDDTLLGHVSADLVCRVTQLFCFHTYRALTTETLGQGDVLICCCIVSVLLLYNFLFSSRISAGNVIILVIFEYVIVEVHRCEKAHGLVCSEVENSLCA
jgi:hypothetical protein